MADDGEDELRDDPRTGLKLILIPPTDQKYFGQLSGAVIHWFGKVDKYNRMWNQQRRVAIFTDQCIYLCQLDGGITRCVNMRWISEIMLSHESAIGFRIGPPDYDMLLSFDSQKDRDDVVIVVQRVYQSIVGNELTVRRLTGNNSEAIQQRLDLSKPKSWSLKIEPVKSRRALERLVKERRQKEVNDRRVVEEEFERIREGLKQELKRYRTEEFERAIDQLSQYVKALEEKDREIEHLKATRVNADDPEVWRKCPNCQELQKLLSSNSNEDKQRIHRLEKALEDQRHIVDTMQSAIQNRSAAAIRQTVSSEGGSSDTALLHSLRAEILESNRRNKDLQQIILESPFLTAEIKQRAASIGVYRDGAGASATGPLASAEGLAERDREIRHLKSLLRDSTARHVEELEAIRGQFKQYDQEVVRYVEKILTNYGITAPQGHTLESLARQTAGAAKHQAVLAPTPGYTIGGTGSATFSSPPRNPISSYASAANALPPSSSRQAGGGGGQYDYSLAASPIRGGGPGSPGGMSIPSASPTPQRFVVDSRPYGEAAAW